MLPDPDWTWNELEAWATSRLAQAERALEKADALADTWVPFHAAGECADCDAQREAVAAYRTARRGE